MASPHMNSHLELLCELLGVSEDESVLLVLHQLV